MWGGLLVVRILGVVPEAGMKSGEIRSDYLIHRWRLPEVAIKMGLQRSQRCVGGCPRGPEGEVAPWNSGLCGGHVESGFKLDSRYSEEGLCSPKSRLKEKVGLLDGVSPESQLIWGHNFREKL